MDAVTPENDSALDVELFKQGRIYQEYNNTTDSIVVAVILAICLDCRYQQRSEVNSNLTEQSTMKCPTENVTNTIVASPTPSS